MSESELEPTSYALYTACFQGAFIQKIQSISGFGILYRIVQFILRMIE